jgi:hypothetical protein
MLLVGKVEPRLAREPDDALERRGVELVGVERDAAEARAVVGVLLDLPREHRRRLREVALRLEAGRLRAGEEAERREALEQAALLEVEQRTERRARRRAGGAAAATP